MQWSSSKHLFVSKYYWIDCIILNDLKLTNLKPGISQNMQAYTFQTKIKEEGVKHMSAFCEIDKTGIELPIVSQWLHLHKLKY